MLVVKTSWNLINKIKVRLQKNHKIRKRNKWKYSTDCICIMFHYIILREYGEKLGEIPDEDDRWAAWGTKYKLFAWFNWFMKFPIGNKLAFELFSFDFDLLKSERGFICNKE